MQPQHDNRLLASLSAPSRELLLERSTHVELPLRTRLYEVARPPAYGWFILSGVASVVTTMADGGTAEVGLIGREGVAGALHLLGPGRSPTDCFMQLEGAALRIRFADLQQAFDSSPEIRARLLEFVQGHVLNVSQIAGCNRLHESEQRLSRWLLMVQDRTQSDVLNITQEFLAQMLGAQRPTVTMVAGALQRSGLIEYQRGRVRIVNRAALEEAACDCYQVAKQLYEDLYTRKLPASAG